METITIILSTRNPSKAQQIKALFADPRITVITLEEAGIEGEAIEDGQTLGENARKKVLHAKEAYGKNTWIMADDTGFYINALDGRPGIDAARWAGDVTTEEITQHTLKQLEGKDDRTATFKTVVCLLTPKGEELCFEGAVNGIILETQRVPPQPKMPYSGIFVPDGSGKVWAEMTTEEENAISHRGEAFRKVYLFLESQLKSDE